VIRSPRWRRSWSAPRARAAGDRVDLAAALRGLAEEEVAADALARLTKTWGFSRLAARALLEDLRSHGVQSEPWALHLHRALHDAPPESTRDVVRSTLADLELAEHSLRADARPLAVEVLETRLAALPSENLGGAAPAARRRPHRRRRRPGAPEPGVRAARPRRGTPDRPDVRAVTRAGAAAPLVGERVRDLAAVATGELRERALAVSAALEPGGLAPRRTAGDGAVARPLGDALLDGILRHPATRRDSPFLARLQTLLASVPVPDVSLLRDYCEQVTAPPHDAAVRAFADAQRALGLGDLMAYVSRGAKGVGVRAYEGRPPFVLIGGQHLTAGEFELSEAELRFALGAELAHLRYGHSRVTSSELWNGALDKGKQGVELALGLVPVRRGWALADKAMRVTPGCRSRRCSAWSTRRSCPAARPASRWRRPRPARTTAVLLKETWWWRTMISSRGGRGSTCRRRAGDLLAMLCCGATTARALRSRAPAGSPPSSNSAPRTATAPTRISRSGLAALLAFYLSSVRRLAPHRRIAGAAGSAARLPGQGVPPPGAPAGAAPPGSGWLAAPLDAPAVLTATRPRRPRWPTRGGRTPACALLTRRPRRSLRPRGLRAALAPLTGAPRRPRRPPPLRPVRGRPPRGRRAALAPLAAGARRSIASSFQTAPLRTHCRRAPRRTQCPRPRRRTRAGSTASPGR
jgi:hypothetical protein